MSKSIRVEGWPTRRAPGESKTAVPISEQLRAGEGGISQPFRPTHQARRSFASKGGTWGGSHRGRPYWPCARKRTSCKPGNPQADYTFVKFAIALLRFKSCVCVPLV